MFRGWFKKKRDDFSLEMIRMCVSTLTTRNLHCNTKEAFAGVAAAELAKAASRKASHQRDSREVRLVSAIFSVVYSQHFSSLIDANSENSKTIAVADILGDAHFEAEFPDVVEVYSILLIKNSDLLKSIKLGCTLWLKDPSLLNFEGIVYLFKVAHNTIAPEPEFAF